jgi:hypothetical protein
MEMRCILIVPRKETRGLAAVSLSVFQMGSTSETPSFANPKASAGVSPLFFRTTKRPFA